MPHRYHCPHGRYPAGLDTSDPRPGGGQCRHPDHGAGRPGRIRCRSCRTHLIIEHGLYALVETGTGEVIQTHRTLYSARRAEDDHPARDVRVAWIPTHATTYASIEAYLAVNARRKRRRRRRDEEVAPP